MTNIVSKGAQIQHCFIRAGIVTLNMIIVQRQKQQVMFGQNSMSGKCLFFRCGVFAVRARLLCQVSRKVVLFIKKYCTYLLRFLGQHSQVLAGHPHGVEGVSKGSQSQGEGAFVMFFA